MTDPVWSIIIFLGIGMIAVAYIIYYIIKMATDELNVPIQDQKDHQSH